MENVGYRPEIPGFSGGEGGVWIVLVEKEMALEGGHGDVVVFSGDGVAIAGREVVDVVKIVEEVEEEGFGHVGIGEAEEEESVAAAGADEGGIEGVLAVRRKECNLSILRREAVQRIQKIVQRHRPLELLLMRRGGSSRRWRLVRRRTCPRRRRRRLAR